MFVKQTKLRPIPEPIDNSFLCLIYLFHYYPCSSTMKKITWAVPWGQFDPILKNALKVQKISQLHIC